MRKELKQNVARHLQYFFHLMTLYKWSVTKEKNPSFYLTVAKSVHVGKRRSSDKKCLRTNVLTAQL